MVGVWESPSSKPVASGRPVIGFTRTTTLSRTLITSTKASMSSAPPGRSPSSPDVPRMNHGSRSRDVFGGYVHGQSFRSVRVDELDPGEGSGERQILSGPSFLFRMSLSRARRAPFSYPPWRHTRPDAQGPPFSIMSVRAPVGLGRTLLEPAISDLNGATTGIHRR